jgi:hypothetical protein
MQGWWDVLLYPTKRMSKAPDTHLDYYFSFFFLHNLSVVLLFFLLIPTPPLPLQFAAYTMNSACSWSWQLSKDFIKTFFHHSLPSRPQISGGAVDFLILQIGTERRGRACPRHPCGAVALWTTTCKNSLAMSGSSWTHFLSRVHMFREGSGLSKHEESHKAIVPCSTSHPLIRISWKRTFLYKTVPHVDCVLLPHIFFGTSVSQF